MYSQLRTHSLEGASEKCLMNFLVPLDTLGGPSLSLCLGDADGDIAGVLRLRFFRACLVIEAELGVLLRQNERY